MIWTFYHAPSITDPKTKEKRHIFNGAGALQSDDTIWRLGADYATVLQTDADLDIGGLAVPKGWISKPWLGRRRPNYRETGNA